jgi:hypothetical protein
MLVQMTRDGVLSRRAFLGTMPAIGASLGLVNSLKSAAPAMRKNGLACILLFMRGAPSQFETFDPKPDTPSGGDTKAIDTALPGVQIAEFWPKLAKQMKDIALIRSMTSREGNHQRAEYLLHTGYQPSGSVKYPNFGAVAAKEIGDENFDLPNFVCVAGTTAASSGFLGMRYAPYLVADPMRMPANSELPKGVNSETLKRRLTLIGKLEKDFAESGGELLVNDQRALNETAARMALSPNLKAFDLSQEKDKVRDSYGRTPFGQGCLLARRLVETGVSFVEVVSSGWDTHRDNNDGHQRLAGIVDPGYASLLQDLKERGMLEKTLVVWMGEFGRTPTINGNKGRDHYTRAFNMAISGAGVKVGQVIGSTDKKGYEVSQRPVTVPDLFCTLYQALKINPRRSNQADGRPIRLVEGGTAVKELVES